VLPVVRLDARSHLVSLQEFLQESLQETAAASSRAEDCRRPANCTLHFAPPAAYAVLEECAMLSFKEGSDSVPMPLSLGRVCHNGHSGTRSWLLEALALLSKELSSGASNGRRGHAAYVLSCNLWLSVSVPSK